MSMKRADQDIQLCYRVRKENKNSGIFSKVKDLDANIWEKYIIDELE